MNAIVKSEESANSISVGFGNSLSFEFTQRAARALTMSTLVPSTFQHKTCTKKAYGDKPAEYADNPNALSNCIIALNMASRMGADPLMVMQNLYVVEGRPSWSSQFIIAAINSCGRFSPLRFTLSDPGEPREVSYEATKWVNRQPVTTVQKIAVRDRTCTAWVIEKETGDRLDGPEVSIAMAEAEGWLCKNGSKWQTMPEVMLRYRAASFFGRLYAPELLMGLVTAEEAHEMIDITPEPINGQTAAKRPMRSDFTAPIDAEVTESTEDASAPEPYEFTDTYGEVTESDAHHFVEIFNVNLAAATTKDVIDGLWETNSPQLARIREEIGCGFSDLVDTAYGEALKRVTAQTALSPAAARAMDHLKKARTANELESVWNAQDVEICREIGADALAELQAKFD